MIKAIYDLDMTPRRTLPIIINVSQYDDIGRTLVFNLFSSSGKWTAPTSAAATFEGGKPDGKFFAYNCAYSNGTVTVTIQQQMTAVAGKVRCKIKVKSGDKVVESAPIIMVVDAAAVPDGSDMSKSDINDAIANATQKIVDQVKDSIPSDYAQLSTDVSSLKQDKVDKPSATDDGKIPRAKEGGVEWVEVGQPTDDQTDSAVTNWLNAHPEATTTVQDGVIGERKIEESFLPWIKKDYVTPEMFGAVGDGVADDTNAIQKMFDSGRTVCAIDESKKYLLSSSIVIKKLSQDITLLGEIIYTGKQYAFQFTCESNSDGSKIGRVTGNVTFGKIIASNGGCLALYPKNGNYGYVSSFILYAKEFSCKTNGIYIYNLGWFNENEINDINFSSGTHAFYCEMPEDATNAEISRLTFNRCHIEGPENGIYIKADGHNYNGIKVFDCRTNEPIPGYYFKVDSSENGDKLINNIIEIYGALDANKFVGDAIYHCNEKIAYVDKASSRIIYLNALAYNGTYINPPLITHQYTGLEIPTEESQEIIADFSNSTTYPLLLRTNYTTAKLKIKVMPLPFPWEYVIPIKTWNKIKFTIKVDTKVTTKTAIIENSSSDTVYFLHVNYYTNEVYIK